MRVLLGHCFYRTSAPSGEDTVFVSEKNLLETNGIEVVSYEKHNDDISDVGILNRLNLALSTAWSRKSYYEVLDVLKKTRPDIAHFHNIFPQMSPSVYQACKDSGVPVVQTLHNFRFICPNAMLMRNGMPCELCLNGRIVPLYALKYKCYRHSLLPTTALVWMTVRNRLNKSFTENVSRYIALSEFSKDKLIKGGLPSGKIVVKSNFIDESYNDGVMGDRADYAVFVGRLKEEKGVETLMRAWQKLPGYPLKIVGDGPLNASLKETANRYNMNVEFMGMRPRNDVISIIRKSKFMIIPSECYENFPMTILESFSNSTPVLAANIGSLGEIVKHKYNGLLFNVRDSDDLSMKAMIMFGDSKLVESMGMNAYHDYLDKYSSKNNYDKLITIYNEILG